MTPTDEYLICRCDTEVSRVPLLHSRKCRTLKVNPTKYHPSGTGTCFHCFVKVDHRDFGEADGDYDVSPNAVPAPTSLGERPLSVETQLLASAYVA